MFRNQKKSKPNQSKKLQSYKTKQKLSSNGPAKSNEIYPKTKNQKKDQVFIKLQGKSNKKKKVSIYMY